MALRQGAAALAALLAMFASQADAQELGSECSRQFFERIVPKCDLQGVISCAPEFGLFRDDLDARDLGCDVPQQLDRLMFARRQELGDDVARIAADSRYQALRSILQKHDDERVSFWVLLSNRSDKDAQIELYALLSTEPHPDLRSIPNDDVWEDQDQVLFEAVARENAVGGQVTERLKKFSLTLSPREVRAFGIQFSNKVAPGQRPGYYPVALLKSDALNHYGVNKKDLLAVGVVRLR